MRRDKRRTHDSLTPVNLFTCPECKQPLCLTGSVRAAEFARKDRDREEKDKPESMAIFQNSDDHAYVLMFPGQGSQYLGMGQDLARESTSAGNCSRRPTTSWVMPCQAPWPAGMVTTSTEPVFAQTATFVHSMALWQVLAGKSRLNPRIAAGHSVGGPAPWS